MDPNSERFAEMRAKMDEAERAKFDEYVLPLPEGSMIVWRCTIEHTPGAGFRVQ